MPLESNRKFYIALKEFDKFILEIIEKKKEELKNKNDNENSKNSRIDLLKMMIELAEQEGIEPDMKQLRDEMVNNFVAGHDSKCKLQRTTYIDFFFY